jgi:hypothetical protein
MKTAKPKEPATTEAQERFERFAKALMAVPKKELDKQLAKDERKKEQRSRVRSRSKTS